MLSCARAPSSLTVVDSSTKPGLAPAGDLLFFASPKKPKEKKGDPTVWVLPLRSRQPVLLDGGGGLARTRFAQTIASPDPASLCAARPSQTGVGEEDGFGETRTRQGASLSESGFVFGSRTHPPSGCAEERKSRRIRAGTCLSEASLCQTPTGLSTARCPAAQRRGRRQRGRLFFAYFLLAKQKKVSSRRATPGQQAQPSPWTGHQGGKC